MFLSVQEAGAPFAHPLSLEPEAARPHVLGRLSGAEPLLDLPAPSRGWFCAPAWWFRARPPYLESGLAPSRGRKLAVTGSRVPTG